MSGYSSIKQKVISFWQEIKPVNQLEKNVLSVLSFYYVLFCCLFIFISLPKECWLGMMGYDTEGHVTYEPQMLCLKNLFLWNIRHPLYSMLCLPMIILNEGLSAIGVNWSWPIFLLSSALLMSMSGLFVFKTLRCLGISVWNSILLLMLYCSFAHVMLLGIQVDSFVLTIFFCTLMVLLYVKGYHNSLTDNLLFFGIAGTTSTNFLKFVVYQFLEEKSFNRLIPRFLRSLLLFSIFFIMTVPNLFFRLVERSRGLLYAIIGDSMNFRGSSLSKYQLFVENFLSEPMVFHHTTGIIYSEETVNLPNYFSPFCYLPIIAIWSLVFFSIIVNRNSRIVYLFILCFGIDLVMHFLIGYGMEEGQLFCGHWIFFIPIILGLLLKKESTQTQWITGILSICSVCMFLLNYYHLLMSL